MAGARREIQEERAIGVDRAQVADVLDRAIGEVGAEVVSVLDAARRHDRVVVVEEHGDELMCLAAVESVPPVESASERPGGA